MNIVDPLAQFMVPFPFERTEAILMLKNIEMAGRTCYKSEDKITAESAQNFIARIVDSGHHSVLEHGNLTARIICDRGVSHELVRHRLCAFSQESTRYCNYSGDKFDSQISVIAPPDLTRDQLKIWLKAVSTAEQCYLDLINDGVKPQMARSVLPTCLKTEVIVTANLRQWRHILNIRVSNPAAHPQIRTALRPLLVHLHRVMPEVFGDIELG